MRILFLAFSISLGSMSCNDQKTKVLWRIGIANNHTSDMMLSPAGYKEFLKHDFGWEDKYFLVGHSDAGQDWPYVLPGPEDTWGGTWSTSGIRSHVLNILFGLEYEPKPGEWKLVIDVLDNSAQSPPLLKVTLNKKSWKYKLSDKNGSGALEGNISDTLKQTITIPVTSDLLRKGGNQIRITTLQGSWLAFDQLWMQGPEGTKLIYPEKAFIRELAMASYEIQGQAGRNQPFLVDVQHLAGRPQLKVELEGSEIFRETLETGRYQFEVPVPATKSKMDSHYKIFIDDRLASGGTITRSPQKVNTPADYVDTKIGSAHSRWMIAPGPWMPFSMVKLSPDNQNAGWQAGYDPTFENIGTFSHIHEWTIGGLGIMPANGPLQVLEGDQSDPDSGYRSRMDKSTEEAPLGYYKVLLKDYNITTELTAQTRSGIQRYTFPKDTASRVMIDLQIPTEYAYQLEGVQLKKVSEHRLEGYSKQHSPNTWSGGVSQEYTLHFVVEFDQPIKTFGTWVDENIHYERAIDVTQAEDAGAFVEFDTRQNQVVQVRSGISLVSIENASENLETEIIGPFGWDFEAVRQHQVDTWNEILERVAISTNDRREKVRFYTNLYRSICSRNIWSDVNGQWMDATERVRKFEDTGDVALGCDAFWNTFWNLNQLWNLVTPEWSSQWVKSQLAMYDANGWLAKGPAGMEYIPVMVAEHEIPMIVGAYQMGIRDYDVDKAFEAIYKTQTTLPQQVGGGLAGNHDLEPYLTYQYVPYDKGRFSNTLEYAYDDWTAAQLAKALGKTQAYEEFSERGEYWRNAIDEETGYARLKNSRGEWLPDFDPFQSGANEQYVEGNSWQLTFFVPQNIPALTEKIGVDRFRERLNWGFEESYAWRFNAPNDQYWDYPIIQGNQQSMHFAFLFNWVGQPWLTQKWSRAIMERYYGNGQANAYLGDEDQGQMSAWFIMNAIGLFQMDGGCRVNPIYEIGSPLFEEITIDLGERHGRGKSFTIRANGVSRLNKYVQSASLNDKELNTFWFPAEELLKGGELTLEMGPEPNKNWGLKPPPLGHEKAGH